MRWPPPGAPQTLETAYSTLDGKQARHLLRPGTSGRSYCNVRPQGAWTNQGVVRTASLDPTSCCPRCIRAIGNAVGGESVLPDWILARNAAMDHLDAWFTKRRPLPPPGTLKCALCGGPVHTRWRSGRDAVKASCLECTMQVDVVRSTAWKVRFRPTDPEPRGPR